MDHATTDVDLDQLDIRATFRDHIFGCFIEDDHGIASLDEIGEDNVMCETDYPHSDSTWPDCIDTARSASRTCPPEMQYKLLRGNAERLYQFTPAEPPVLAGRDGGRDVRGEVDRDALHRQRHVRRLRARHLRPGRARRRPSCVDALGDEARHRPVRGRGVPDRGRWTIDDRR